MANKLFYGDNLDVLRRKIADESVDLCYIDPPFNSKRNYFQIYNNQGDEDRAQAQAFIDTWEWGDEAELGLRWITDIAQLQNGKLTEQTVDLIRGLEKVLKHGALLAYLVHMTLRIVEIHRVLKPTGSFYLHCDSTASHYLKLVLDAVFCGQGGNFQNEIIWQKIRSSKAQTIGFGSVHDTIFYYTRTGSATFNKAYVPLSADRLRQHYSQVEDGTGRRYMLDNFTQAGPGEARRFGDKVLSPPRGKHWIWGQDRIDQAMDAGRLVLTSDTMVRVKRYLDESRGNPVEDIWTDIAPLNSQAQERLGYPTQKPEALLERIIKASSNEGDVVLDAYCGCGTSVAVAQRLGRQWIGIDITYQSISLILKRLQDTYPAEWPVIEANLLLDGVPRDMASAVALANRKDDKTRKEFEKWSVLTYSNNQARINEKKGADAGIDGIAFFLIDADTNGKAIFQVKSAGANRATLATLNSDRQREKAEFGFLISMDPPTKAMREEIAAAGKYKHPLLNREDDRIRVITVADILAGKRLDLPMARLDAVRSAKAAEDDRQGSLL